MRSACLPSALVSLAVLGLATSIASCGGVDESKLGPPPAGMDAGSAERDAGGGTDAATTDAGSADAGDVVVCGGTTCMPFQRCCGDVGCGRCVERGTACPPIDCGPDAGPPPGDAGPPPPRDAGPPPPRDAGPPPTGCGGMSCLPGFTCCGTAACGTCIPFGTGCMPPRCDDAGAPAPRCGGLFDPPCGAGLFCDTPGCGSLGTTGTCQPRPTDCTGAGTLIVCGCDRNNYDNPCQARRAGVSVAHTGPCDCREMSCPIGQHCIECGAGWGCRVLGC